jgi:hypothetical protein
MLQLNRAWILWGWVDQALGFEVGGCQTSNTPTLEARKQAMSLQFLKDN